MPTPHKHADLIKAWADGAAIELQVAGVWQSVPFPAWGLDSLYRVKPVPHKWQKEMDAFAAGTLIEARPHASRGWLPCPIPQWATHPGAEYRIKPEKVVRFTRAWEDKTNGVTAAAAAWKGDLGDNNLKLTFEDGKLVKAEVIGG